MRFTIINNIDILEREEYIFILTDRLEIKLNYYYLQTRETVRHKWKNKKIYCRTTARDNTIEFNQIKIHDFFIDNVKNQIINAIKFTND